MVELDRKAIEVLQAIQQNGGEANTSEIRARTGLKNNIIHYRYDKLEDLGLIETEPGDKHAGGGLPPTIARLTEQGVEELEEGLVSGTALPPDTVDELEDRIQRLEVRMDAVDAVEEFDDRIQALEERMDSTWELLGAIRTHLEDRDDIDFEEMYFD